MTNECGKVQAVGAAASWLHGLCGERKALMAASHLCLERRKQRRVPSNDETLFTKNG